MGYRRKCQNCTKEFEVKRSWQIFCQAKCRRQFNQANYDRCFYCGALAEHRDHIVATHERGGRKSFANQETVRCCKTCNTTLGSEFFGSVVDRVEYLLAHYKKKLKKNRIPEWDEDDLREMGRNMRQRIRKAYAIMGDLEARIGHLVIKRNDFSEHETLD